MKVPSKVFIKGKLWKVRQANGLLAPDGEAVMGFCNPNDRTIYIEKSIKGNLKTQTFLHELNHAIIFELHLLLDGHIEEVLVEGMACVYSDLFTISVPSPARDFKR